MPNHITVFLLFYCRLLLSIMNDQDMVLYDTKGLYKYIVDMRESKFYKKENVYFEMTEIQIKREIIRRLDEEIEWIIEN